ncbi:ferritin-like domain-containing protein [Helcococcus bovis]|uniref:ferritin-like domain-containing protein n=1 Tax=Helcococcus bovis TaxID=3153252 RepID=UPI0038BD2290
MLDLGGKVELQQREALNLIEDPIEFLKADLEISKDGVAIVDKLVEASITDHISYDLLKEYYKNEVEDLLWSETELELIEKIGKGKWLLLQL